MSSTRTHPPPARAASAPGQGSPQRLDASMALLREVMDHPLDPSYARAAARRARGERPGRGVRAIIAAVAVLCGLLVTGTVLELRRPEPGQAAGRVALEREITRRGAEADARLVAIQRLRAQIAVAQQQQLSGAGQQGLAVKGQQLELATGELPVTGPGMEISLQDAATPGNGAVLDPRAVVSGADDGRVLDRDLQIVVNGLWASGAEAVSINGRRLTALSAIRSAGLAILVDFRPLKPPYVIQAIGDPKLMPGRFAADAAGSYVQSLRDNYGVQVAVTSAARLVLPGAASLELRKATPQVSPSGSTSASATPSVSTSEVPS
jgi:uncharacterized protein YlxW (UPF0749 family)